MKYTSSRLSSYLVKNRWILFISLLLFIVLIARFLNQALLPNNDISIWFSEDDPSLQEYYEFNKIFGNDRLIFLSFAFDSGLITHSNLNKIDLLTKQINKISGVKEVISLTNAKDVQKIKRNTSNSIEFRSYFENGIPNSIQKLSDYKESILSSKLMINRVINQNGKVGMIIIQLSELEKIDSLRNNIIKEINNVSTKILGADNVHLGGLDIITYELNKLSKHDFTLFLSLNYALMILIILIFFPNIVYLILTILTTFLSIIITLSIYGYYGHSLNIFTIIIPSLIIVIGMIIVLHVINEFEFLIENNEESHDSINITKLALANVFKPCLFATLTTMIGFLSLLSSSTSVLREFGLFAALGLLIVFVCGYVLSALLLSMRKISSVERNPRLFIANNLVHLSDHIFRNSKMYWLILIMIIVISTYGITRINVDMHTMGYFPSNSKIVKDHNFMIDNWGDYFPIDAILETKKSKDIRDPRLINAIIEFENEASKLPIVRNTYSFVDLIDRYSIVVYNKNFSFFIDKPMIRNPMINNLTRMKSPGSHVLMNNDYTKARIILIGPLMSIKDLKNGIKEILEIGNKHFGELAKLKVMGFPALYIKLLDYAFGSLKNSLFYAFIFVFIAIIFLLRNLKVALIAMIPNVFPIITFLGFLGVFRINLDLATATIAAIILGIAIDDTIHFLNRYLKEKKNSKIIDAVNKTHYRVGRIIVISSLILFLGFSLLLFASINTVFYFGLLMSFSVISALIGDLVILPLILRISD